MYIKNNPCHQRYAVSDLLSNTAGWSFISDMSRIIRRPVFGVSDQVKHKSGCTTDPQQMARGLKFRSTGIALSMLCKIKALISCVVTSQLICTCFSHMQKAGFLMTWFIYELRREKTSFCIRENKDADQLRGNHEADQRLCFRYMDSTISLLPKYEISSLQPSSVAVQPGLCGTWSESQRRVFS